LLEDRHFGGRDEGIAQGIKSRPPSKGASAGLWGEKTRAGEKARREGEEGTLAQPRMT